MCPANLLASALIVSQQLCSDLKLLSGKEPLFLLY